MSCLKNICGKTQQNDEGLSGKLEKELGEENNLARKEELKDTSVPILVQNSLGCRSECLLPNPPALYELALQTGRREAIPGQGMYNSNTLLTL